MCMNYAARGTSILQQAGNNTPARKPKSREMVLLMSGAPPLTPDSFECSCAGGPPRLCRSRWAGGAVLLVAAERLGAGVHEHRRRHAAVDRLPVLHGEPNRCLSDTIQLVD